MVSETTLNAVRVHHGDAFLEKKNTSSSNSFLINGFISILIKFLRHVYAMADFQYTLKDHLDLIALYSIYTI